jgi:hypothetical protein
MQMQALKKWSFFIRSQIIENDLAISASFHSSSLPIPFMFNIVNLYDEYPNPHFQKHVFQEKSN